MLSHSNGKRGGLLALVALGVTAVTAIGFPQDVIWFGVLHMLSTCLLLYALSERVLRRIPAAAGTGICALLFLLCWNVPVQNGEGFFGIPGWWEVPVSPALIRQPWLYPLGLGIISGTQGDYFPLLPWIFCFLTGSFVGRATLTRPLPAWLYRRHLPPLAFIGRHALVIYILHQPIIYGISLFLALAG